MTKKKPTIENHRPIVRGLALAQMTTAELTELRDFHAAHAAAMFSSAVIEEIANRLLTTRSNGKEEDK